MNSTLDPTLFPVSVAASDGSLDLKGAKAFITFDQASQAPTHLTVYNTLLAVALDADIDSAVVGANPRLMSGRHELTLTDGRIVYLRQERGGCNCSGSARQLKNFTPGSPATSGYRP